MADEGCQIIFESAFYYFSNYKHVSVGIKEKMVLCSCQCHLEGNDTKLRSQKPGTRERKRVQLRIII